MKLLYNPSGYILATASWVSTFVLIWLIIAEAVKPFPAYMFLVFFFCLAVVVSTVVASRKNGKKEKGGQWKRPTKLRWPIEQRSGYTAGR